MERLLCRNESSPSVEAEPSADERGGQKVSVSHCLGSGSSSAGHSSVGVLAERVDTGLRSQIVVELVLVRQVDPAEDESGQS